MTSRVSSYELVRYRHSSYRAVIPRQTIMMISLHQAGYAFLFHNCLQPQSCSNNCVNGIDSGRGDQDKSERK